MPGLFDPLRIRNLELPNRLVFPPMANNLATPQGEITPRHIDHYVARARGGAGLIIVEHTYVMPSGRLSKGQPGICEDSQVPGHRRLVEAVHQAGAKVCLQINHAGARTIRALIGEQPWGPSDVPLSGGEVPRPMTKDDIGQVVQAFSGAAQRAIRAGYDAVEIHGAHGFLLSQFVSPLTNRRTDEYGGSTEGRLRLSLEAIIAVRQLVGADFPVFYRFGADDLLEGGITPEEAQRMAPRLVEAGLDLLDVSGGIGGSGRERFTEQGYFVPLAQSIKAVVRVPVIGVGNITQPEFADRVLREGRVDLVAVGRAQLSNPEWGQMAAQRLGAIPH